MSIPSGSSSISRISQGDGVALPPPLGRASVVGNMIDARRMLDQLPEDSPLVPEQMRQLLDILQSRHVPMNLRADAALKLCTQARSKAFKAGDQHVREWLRAGLVPACQSAIMDLNHIYRSGYCDDEDTPSAALLLYSLLLVYEELVPTYFMHPSLQQPQPPAHAQQPEAQRKQQEDISSKPKSPSHAAVEKMPPALDACLAHHHPHPPSHACSNAPGPESLYADKAQQPVPTGPLTIVERKALAHQVLGDPESCPLIQALTHLLFNCGFGSAKLVASFESVLQGMANILETPSMLFRVSASRLPAVAEVDEELEQDASSVRGLVRAWSSRRLLKGQSMRNGSAHGRSIDRGNSVDYSNHNASSHGGSEHRSSNGNLLQENRSSHGGLGVCPEDLRVEEELPLYKRDVVLVAPLLVEAVADALVAPEGWLALEEAMLNASATEPLRLLRVVLEERQAFDHTSTATVCRTTAGRTTGRSSRPSTMGLKKAAAGSSAPEGPAKGKAGGKHMTLTEEHELWEVPQPTCGCKLM